MKKEILFIGIGLLCLFLAGCKTKQSVAENQPKDTVENIQPKGTVENMTKNTKEALIEKYWKLIELDVTNVT